MTRHFGNPGGARHPGAMGSRSACRANTPRELPSGSILSVPPLERGNIPKALIDILAGIFIALFVCSFASGIGLVLYVLYLVLRS